MIYVFTGNGKGKTTAAIGTGIRALGAGKKVFMIQFLKTEKGSSEVGFLKKLKNFEIRCFGREGFFLPKEELEKKPELKKYGVKPLSKIDFQLANEGFELAREVARGEKFDLLILDEINIALNFSLLDKKRFLSFLTKNRDNLDIILTGRNCPEYVLEVADLVSNVQEVKHYYRKGKGAKKGIDY